MKPTDLKPPFKWDNRQILINDRVWYVPARVENNFVFPGWEHPDLFGNNNPVCVEYCSGNGAWLAAKALAYPAINWLGVEKKYERVRKVWSKVKNLELKNLVVLCGEAHNATKHFFPDHSVYDVYVNFPDPWPKTRHAKHRLIQGEFVQELWRILNEGRSLTFVTDDVPYSEWLIEVMQQHGGFHSTYPDPYYVTDQDQYGTSYFDALWRSKGRTIRYHQFKKIKAGMK